MIKTKCILCNKTKFILLNNYWTCVNCGCTTDDLHRGECYDIGGY
jgi:hypothetical protein